MSQEIAKSLQVNQSDSTVESSGRLGYFLLALAVVLGVMICAGGWFYYVVQYQKASSAARESLATIADSKATQISNWMKERRGDAEVARAAPAVTGMLANSTSAVSNLMSVHTIQVFRKVYSYAAFVVAHPQGEIVFKDPADFPLQDSEVADHVQTAMHAQHVVVSELHRTGPDGVGYLWLSCPILAQATVATPPDGAVLLIVDLHTFLFPTLQRWPTRTNSAETLLALNENGSVEYLNDFRFNTDTNPGPGEPPVSKLPVLSSLLVGGKEGVFDATDYRGVAVIAAIRKVPDTPWVLATKMDTNEIFAPLDREAWEVGIITALLLLATALGIGLLWREQKLVYVRRELAERKRVEESTALLASIVESSDDAIVSTTLDGVIASWNHGAEKLFGYSANEAVGQPLILIIPLDRINEGKEILARIQRGETVRNFETVRVAKSRMNLDVSVTISPLRGLDDAIIGASGITRDITERKRVETALIQSEERFSLMFRSSPIPITLSRLTDGSILDANSSFLSMSGFTREEVIGHTPLELNVYPDPSRRAFIMEQLHQHGRLYVHEQLFRTKSGQLRQHLLWFDVITISGEQCILVSALDITEQKRAQEEMLWKTAFLEAQVDSTLDGILVVDDHSKRILQNQRLMELFKVPDDIARDDDDSKLLQHVTQQTKNPKKFSERVAYLYAHRDEKGRDELELKDGTIFDSNCLLMRADVSVGTLSSRHALPGTSATPIGPSRSGSVVTAGRSHLPAPSNSCSEAWSCT